MKRPEISASYKVTSAPPNSSKKRKSTSDVWNHFIKETDQNGMVWAKCQHCGKRFSGLSKDGTTHLKNHLNTSKCKRSQKETGGLENPTVNNGNFVFDEERSGLKMVELSYRMKKQKDEVTRLQLSNCNLVQMINAREQNYGVIESANKVLRAQHAELTDRLRSLKSLLQMIEEMSGFSVDIPDSMMNHGSSTIRSSRSWLICSCLDQ